MKELTKLKRIGLLIPDLNSGGAERVISLMSKVLDEETEVFLILFNGKIIKYDFSGNLININLPSVSGKLNKITNFFFRIRRLNKIKRTYKLDIVISFLRAANIVNYGSNSIGKKLISVRGYSDYKKSGKMYSYMQKKLDGIIFPSNLMLSNFTQNFSVDSKKSVLLYNPVNIDLIEESIKSPLQKDVLSFIKKHKAICSVGSFKKDKGQWNLLKSFFLLKKEIPNAGLLFIGTNGELEEDIKEMVRKSPYKESIMFVGHQDNPYNIISNCEVFVLPSLNEGFPNVLLEAMACKVPVISTNCNTGPSEILLDNYLEAINIHKSLRANYGILIPQFSEEINFDPQKIEDEHLILKEELNAILVDETLNNEYREKAKERSRKFDLSAFKKDMLRIINSI